MNLPLEYDHKMAMFTFVPIVADLDTGPRRLVLSAYRLWPFSGSECRCFDAQAPARVLLERLEGFFAHTRGVPPILATRAVRPLGRRRWGEPEWTPQFTRFCNYYGCRPLDVPDYDWDKELRTAFIGRPYATIEELRMSQSPWPAPPLSVTANLLRLPSRMFFTHQEVYRRVCVDGFLCHRGDYYSVPQTYAGRNLWVQCADHTVRIATVDGEIIADHLAGTGNGQVIMDLEHFTPRHRHNRNTRNAEQAFLQRFPDQRTFLSLLVAQQRNWACDTLRAILQLADHHAPTALAATFQKCVNYNNFSHRFVKGILAGGDRACPGCSRPLQGVQCELL